MNDVVTLDKRDRRILFELDTNCRQQLTALAAKLKLPIETLRYRIQRLVDSGVIKNFITVIDGGRLGFYYFKVFLRLHNVNETKVNEILRRLVENPRICWVVQVDGSYDIGFTPRVSNPGEQSDLMDELRSEFADCIQSWTLSVNVKMDFLSRDYLIKTAERQTVLGSYSTKKPAYRMDSLEDQVLGLLAGAPRSTGAELAKQLGVSTETVLSRIRRLEREQVVVRYMTVVNNQLLGQINYYILVFFSRLDPQREAAFVQFCAAHPNVVYLIKSLGPWDYELNIEVASLSEGRRFIMHMNQQFTDIIREHQALIVHQIHKYVYP